MRDRGVRTGARIVCAVAFVAAVGGLGAQTRLYKSVGPDGRITWTDKPPTVEDATNSRPAPPPGRSGPSAGTPAPGLPGRSGGIPALAMPPSVAELQAARVDPHSRNPAAERAARIVILQADMVMHTLQQCGSDLLENRRKYSTAIDAWQERNAEVVRRAFAAAGDLLGPDKRVLFRGTSIQEIDRSLAGYRRAATADKERWCEHQWQQVDGGRMDPVRDAAITAALQAYPAGKP